MEQIICQWKNKKFFAGDIFVMPTLMSWHGYSRFRGIVENRKLTRWSKSVTILILYEYEVEAEWKTIFK